jgi:hypothetical protein
LHIIIQTVVPEFSLVIRWSRVKIATPLLNAKRHNPAASKNMGFER